MASEMVDCIRHDAVHRYRYNALPSSNLLTNNDSCDRAAAKRLRFQNPRCRPLRFTAWFLVFEPGNEARSIADRGILMQSDFTHSMLIFIHLLVVVSTVSPSNFHVQCRIRSRSRRTTNQFSNPLIQPQRGDTCLAPG
jgi:hypothetical protein